MVRIFHLQEFVRSTTPRRAANLMLNRVQRLLRVEHVAGLPSYYFIDPINVCNLRCPLCPTGRGIVARPSGRMRLTDLKRLVDEIAPYAYRIELYNWGEPLLHPEVTDMIRYASQRRISVGLSSNLNLLDPELARRLVESGLAQLSVSIDGITQESYATYRRRGQLDVVLNNLALLLQTRRELKRHRPRVIWRMLVGRHNQHEVEAARRLARQMGADAFATGPLFVDTQDPAQVEEWLPTDPAYSSYDLAHPENHWRCDDLWQSMVINWDGGVAPCCWLHHPQYDLGSVATSSVRQVWTGPAYLSARRAVAHRTPLPGEVRTICHRCRGRPHYLAT